MVETFKILPKSFSLHSITAKLVDFKNSEYFSIQFWDNVLSPWKLNVYEKVYLLTKNRLWDEATPI